MSYKKISLLILILLLGFLLRFYQLGTIPLGLNLDEASQSYNAYSLLLTGKDRYDQSFPIMFRSLGSYQPPLYTYLSILPTLIFSPSVFSIRLISAISGMSLILITFLFIYTVEKFRKENLDLLTTLIVAIVPWAVFFSRGAVEANLGLIIFITSIFFFYLSLHNPKLFILGSFFLGLTSYAYYAERLSGILFLFFFLLLFKDKMLKNKKIILIGLMIFFILQIPLMTIINSSSSIKRLDQVNYLSDTFFYQNGGNFTKLPLGKFFYATREFMSQYLAYFSPKNLFFDPDPQGVRSMPDLSVFYIWMIIPFFIGLKVIYDNRSNNFIKIIILLLIIVPIPAALTRDPFYTTRVLPLLWATTIIISLGIYRIIAYFSAKWRILFILFLMFISLASLYISYFVLLKHERLDSYGYPYMEVIKISEEIPNKKFIIDTGRNPYIYIWLLAFKKYDPILCQHQNNNLKATYYDNIEFKDCSIIDNIEVRPIFWQEDIYKEQILVGDSLAISDDQIKEHQLKLEFEIKDLNGAVKLKGYSTLPKLKI